MIKTERIHDWSRWIGEIINLNGLIYNNQRKKPMSNLEIDAVYRPQSRGRCLKNEELFALLLKRYLVARKMTKEELAYFCYAPQELIDSLLNGEIPKEIIDYELLSDIATALETSVVAFLVVLERLEGPDVEKAKEQIILEAEDIVKHRTQKAESSEQK